MSNNLYLSSSLKTSNNKNTIDILNIDTSYCTINTVSSIIDISSGIIDTSSGIIDISSSIIDISFGIIDTSSGIVDTSSYIIDTSSCIIDTSSCIIDTSSGIVDTSSGIVDTSSGIVDTSSGIDTSTNPITCLCFSGGGMKGAAFIGAMKKLEKNNIINFADINLFVGTSVGSIIAYFLNIGLTLVEIEEFILTFNFAKINNDDVDCINLLQNYGLNDGERAKLILSKFLELKFGVSDITFEELYKLTNKKIIIISTNITKGCEAIFSVDTTPLYSVILAIRMSISIPIIFTPIIYNNDTYVDGGLSNNFPINHCPKNATFGFYIKNCKTEEIHSIQDFIRGCLNVITDTISEKNIKKYKNKVIQIINDINAVSNFDVTYEYKKEILALGKRYAKEYIKNNEN
jgi:predicted patatin/cPLA2 family phospholipase